MPPVHRDGLRGPALALGHKAEYAQGGMDQNEVIRRYALFLARPAVARRTGSWDAEPRRSLVGQVEAEVRRWLFSLSESRSEAVLLRLEDTVREIGLTVADMDSVTLIFDWSRDRKKRQLRCPCRPLDECPLLFKEVGFGPDQDPADRATPEELAQCPLQQPRELELRVQAPKGNVKKWWRSIRGKPATGIVVCQGADGKQDFLDVAEGKTVAQMMRLARRVVHRWATQRAVPAAPAQVILLTPTTLDKVPLLE